jgi:hypothetical protein
LNYKAFHFSIRRIKMFKFIGYLATFLFCTFLGAAWGLNTAFKMSVKPAEKLTDFEQWIFYAYLEAQGDE